MLRRHLSLTIRAAMIFVCVYLAMFLAMLMMMSAASFSVDGDGHHSGPRIAATFAARELAEANGTIGVRNDGSFASFAAKHPRLWIIGERDGRRFSFGAVPSDALTLFQSYAGVLDTGRFHVPGVSRPFSDASISRRDTQFGDVILAAGGVDPASISFADAFRYWLIAGMTPLLVLGTVGLLAMLMVLPIITRALKRVAADAASIRPEKPDRRIDEARVPSELLPLVRGFNAALDRLASELGRRKRFIADVAHELRTPLAIASLQIDLLDDSEEKSGLRRVIVRLSHLIAQMVDVERLSLAGNQRLEFDLAALARDAIADLAPMAIGAGYELGLEAPAAPVMVTGDPHALGRAISNLIGNAVAHGGGRGQIQVIISDWRTLDVVDEGPGVPSAIRTSLFEPFCREHWDRDGCGLGLHLTREIMRAHGGDAVLLRTERGAAFRLEFP